MIGVFLGVFVFGEILFPLIEGFYYSGNLGKVTLPDWLGIKSGVVALFVVIVAIAAFWLAEKTERDWQPYSKLESK